MIRTHVKTTSGNVAAPVASASRPAARIVSRVGGTFLLLVILGLTSRVVGFLREMFLAAQFGAGHEMDAFLAGQTVPGVAQRLFDELLGSSLLPLFAAWCARWGEARAWAHLNRLLRFLVIFGAGLVVMGALLAGPLVRSLAPGLGKPDSAIAARSLQIMLPGIGFLLLGSSYTALLNYYRRFLVVAGLTLASNLAIVLCIVLLADRLGVYSAAVGMSVGALLLAASQWPFLPACGRREPAMGDGRPVVAEFARLAKPLAFGILLFSLIPVVERFLASWLPEGSIAVLNYAFKVDWLVYLVFVVPITTMAFPRLAESAAAGDQQRFLHVLIVALKAVLLLLLPMIVFLLVSGDPVIRLLFERGNFSAARTGDTAAVLRVYVLGLPAAAATLVLFYAVYALQQPGARLTAGVLAVGIGACGGLVLTTLLGVRGIAATHVLNFTTLAVFLGWYLRRILAPDWWRPLTFFSARALLAGVASFPVSWLAARTLERTGLGTSPLWQAARLVTVGFVTISVFLGLCWLLRLAEVRSLLKELRDLRDALARTRSEAIS